MLYNALLEKVTEWGLECFNQTTFYITFYLLAVLVLIYSVVICHFQKETLPNVPETQAYSYIRWKHGDTQFTWQGNSERSSTVYVLDTRSYVCIYFLCGNLSDSSLSNVDLFKRGKDGEFGLLTRQMVFKNRILFPPISQNTSR